MCSIIFTKAIASIKIIGRGMAMLLTVPTDGWVYTSVLSGTKNGHPHPTIRCLLQLPYTQTIFSLPKYLYFLWKYLYFLWKYLYFLAKYLYFLAKYLYFLAKYLYFFVKNIFYTAKQCLPPPP